MVFTEMLGVDSTPLRVDLRAANRVLLHGGRESALCSELQNGETLQDAIGKRWDGIDSISYYSSLCVCVCVCVCDSTCVLSAPCSVDELKFYTLNAN